MKKIMDTKITVCEYAYKSIIVLLIACCLITMNGCNTKKTTTDAQLEDHNQQNNNGIESDDSSESKEPSDVYMIDATGMTLSTRIKTPEGFTRTEAESGSFSEFVRDYPMKEDGSKVLLYNGSEKGNQNAHVAVFKLPIENYDLQQCADSIMRMYAEYYWNTKQYNKISFHFVSGFEAKFSKWIQGYNIFVLGNKVSWIRDRDCDASYESFKKYMRMVFNYAGTLSMDKEAQEIDSKDIQIGDIFIKGGSPGHVVMIVDICVDNKGNKAFLLAQGYMPAQEFHVLKNPAYENNVWYYANEISYPFSTPEYSFEQGSLRRPIY